MASMFYLTALFVHYQDEFAIASVQHAWQAGSTAAGGSTAATRVRVAAA